MRIAVLALTACGRIGFSSEPAPDASQEGLLAWYRMEDDPSDGTLENSAGFEQPPALCISGQTCGMAAPGPVGNALLLDGVTQFYRLTSSPAFLTPTFTVALWARFDRSTHMFNFAVTKLYGAIHNSWSLFIDDQNAVFESVHEPGPKADFEAISPRPVFGQWHHYAFTWDGSTKRGYLDGVKLLEGTVPGVAFDESDLLIGADEDRGVVYGYWDGALDEIRIYDRVVGDAEIQVLARP